MPTPIGRPVVAVPTLPRNFADELTSAKSSGNLDAASAQRLVTGWGARPLSAADASALKSAVLSGGAVTDPAARQTLQRFLATLPSTDPRQDINVLMLGAPQLHKEDVGALVQHWSGTTHTPEQAAAIDTAALEAAPRMDAEAKKAMQSFLLDKLPQNTNAELARSPRTTLLIAAFDDGHIDARDAQRLVQQWSSKPMSVTQADTMRRNVLGSQGFIDPGEARETIQRFLDGKLQTPLAGNEHHDYDAELETAKLGDGKISPQEVQTLTTAWSQEHFSDNDAKAVRAAVERNAAAIEGGPAQAQLQGFVDRRLPRLIVNNPSSSAPGHAKLSWTPPFANTDGTPLTNLGGYLIRFGQTSGALDQQLVVSDPAATTADLNNLGAGTWYFAAITTTTDGLMSAPSNEVSKTFP